MMTASCVQFSFIIPVYRAEKYINRCINSILSQTFHDFEIILVDDGSPDNSGKMCDEFAKQHDFIRSIHQKNKGASAARNNGIRNAKGNYLIFLDSDDFWIDTSGLEKVYQKALESPDIIVFASKDYYEKSNQYHDDRYTYYELMNHLSPIECLDYMIKNDRFNLHPGKRAIRKEFLTNNGLWFIEGIRSEDVELGIRMANCLPTYRFINEKIYVYCHHDGSVTATIGMAHLKEYTSIIKKLSNWDYKNERVKGLLLSYLGYQFALFLAHCSKIKPDGYRELLEEMKDYTFLFQYQSYKRTRLIYYCYRIWGYRITCILLGIYLGRGKH